MRLRACRPGAATPRRRRRTDRPARTRTTPCLARSGVARRVQPSSRMPSPAPSRAISVPMGPRPTRPSVLPRSSMPEKLAGLPAPLARAHEGGADVAREGQDHGQRVLGYRGGAVVGRVGHGDAAARRLRHVDAARVADAEEADEAQPLARAQHLGVHLGVVEDHRLGRAQPLDERRPVGRRAVVEVDRPQRAQGIELGGMRTQPAPSGKTIRMATDDVPYCRPCPP